MSTASLGVLVAAFAVVVGAGLQLLAIRSVRADTIRRLRADVVEAHAARLRDALAEYMTLTYWTDSEYKSFQLGLQRTLSDEYFERADREDRLYNLIRLYSDPENPRHVDLLSAVEYLRAYNKDVLWIHRRDRLVLVAREAFAAETQQLVR